MSGYPNPYKLWCGRFNPPRNSRQGCIDQIFPGSLNGILGRGSTEPKMQNYPIADVMTNLRWDERSSENAMSRRRSRVASNNITFYPSLAGMHLSPITLYEEASLDEIWGSGSRRPPYVQGAQTPFRAMMNAGDPNMSYHSNIAGPEGYQHFGGYSVLDPLYTRTISQVSSTRRASNAGWRVLAGGIHTGGQSLWTGNQKFVYDGSDYVTFKKLQAKNRNYNDPTFGGDQYNASQVALARVRH